jgi:hypothetical protein
MKKASNIDIYSELKPFYVYELITSDNSTFYVGEGQEDRAFQHKKEVGIDITKKQTAISTYSQEGIDWSELVIARFDSKTEVQAVESTLINWVYGISHLQNTARGRGVAHIREKGILEPLFEEDIKSKPYYTYILVNSEDNKVFYVGKGKGKRLFEHQKSVKQKGIKTQTHKMINKILESGFEIKELIIGRFKTEEEAFAVESILIHWVYGIENLTNETSGHKEEFIRPKGNYNVIISIDEPSLGYSEREIAKREKHNVVDYLKSIQEYIESRIDFKFDYIDPKSHSKHTYLTKIIKGVRLTVVSHHKAKKSASVTIESVDGKKENKAKVLEICNQTCLYPGDKGRYGRIKSGTITDYDEIFNSFVETYNEILKVKN